MSTTPLYVGIDVAKAHLDRAVRPTTAQWRVANTDDGIPRLTARRQGLAPTLVVLEATGGYERAVTAAVAVAGIPVAVVNPRQVRDFATATGKLAKPDVLDAVVLAPFADAVRPDPRPLPPAAAQRLAAGLARRQQVVSMLVAEQNRRPVAAGSLRPGIARHIAGLEHELHELDNALDQAIRSSPLWRAQDQLLRSSLELGQSWRPPCWLSCPNWAR